MLNILQRRGAKKIQEHQQKKLKKTHNTKQPKNYQETNQTN